MALKLTKRFPYTVTIDGEPVRLHFKKMTVEEFAIFEAQFIAHKDERKKPDERPLSASKQLSAEQLADLKGNAAWLRESFGRYLTVEPGDLEIDGVQIESGADFFDATGTYSSVLVEVLTALYLEQCLTSSQKKTLRSLPASEIGSDTAPLMAGSGERPAVAAEPAATLSSAPIADATSPSSVSSGTTAQLSSEPVPSGSLA